MCNRVCPSCKSDLRMTYQADGWRCASCKHMLAYDPKDDKMVLATLAPGEWDKLVEYHKRKEARAIAQADGDPGDCHA